MDPVQYPYLPEGRTLLRVPEGHPAMREAQEVARTRSKDSAVPTGAVIVQAGVVVGRGANGSDYHRTHGCERVRQNIPTGQRYELCEGCSPKNHAEPRAIEDALAGGHTAEGADLYLWGHWWCCESCWRSMEAAGVRNVFLLEGSERLFNKSHPDSILSA